MVVVQSGCRWTVSGEFAWSRPAALRLATEIGILTSLGREPRVPFLAEVVASSTHPVLLVTRFVPGSSLFEVIDTIDRERAGQQLAGFLAALHHPAARQHAEAAVGKLTGAHLPPATTATLRERFAPMARPGQRPSIMRWCDWADTVLTSPGPAVLVHGDLHSDNQVWDHDKLRLVVDLETAGAAEPEYDLRTFPGPAMGPGVELLTAVMRRYQQLTGRQLSTNLVMAWHLRTALATRYGAPRPESRSPITAPHRTGSTTWPRGSACSASTPKRHPLSTRAKHRASPSPRISAQIQPPGATNSQVSMMYSPRAHKGVSFRSSGHALPACSQVGGCITLSGSDRCSPGSLPRRARSGLGVRSSPRPGTSWATPGLRGRQGFAQRVDRSEPLSPPGFWGRALPARARR